MSAMMGASVPPAETAAGESRPSTARMWMPPETAPGGCLWLDAGCAASSAFKATGSRFAKAQHDITPITNSNAFRHLGPGYYDVGKDMNRPSMEHTMRGGTSIKGVYNPMKDLTPRFGYTPYAMITECQKPGNEHMGPGDHTAGHGSFIKRSKAKKDMQQKSAFGSSLSSPRMRAKTKHERMMEKIWTRFDHFEAQNRAWGKSGAYISEHEQRFEPPESDDVKKEKRKEGRKQDAAFRKRIHALSKTGKPDVRSQRSAHEPSSTTDPHRSHTKESSLGGAKGVAWSTVQRFGYSPFEQKTEMQYDHTAHIGPGAYARSGESGSIRARTAVTNNHSAAFAATSPRFGRRQRVLIGDGGLKRRLEKEERTKRKLEIKGLYGEQEDDHEDQRPATVR